MAALATLRTLPMTATLLIVFLDLGLGRPEHGRFLESRSSDLCQPQRTIKGEPYYGSCKCKGGNLDDGKNCLKTALGVDYELTGKQGKCRNGECILNNITRGCEGKPQQVPEGSAPPVGCVYYCGITEIKYNYFSVGTKCQHIIQGSQRVNGTCQKEGDRVICKEQVSAPPAC
uniref:Putative secreted protein n=1 Tax=Amblyomma cajennense TaxID=34607 RepID=A0A023FC30_AMBCJ